VISQACRDASSWPEQVKVTVNLSALQLENGDLPIIVRHALADAKLSGRRLEFEVSENVIARGAAVCDTLDELRALGAAITLDNFGKSSGALASLQSYRFDKVKIDRALVRDIAERADSAEIVKAVAMLVRGLGSMSVAEGVETRSELDFVVNAGCNKAQGFYFSRPVPAAELKLVLSECAQKFALAA
jgi:EAL domain-containing protein (putative c-di-GMP-specific phosphodiesterase class I)